MDFRWGSLGCSFKKLGFCQTLLSSQTHTHTYFIESSLFYISCPSITCNVDEIQVNFLKLHFYDHACLRSDFVFVPTVRDAVPYVCYFNRNCIRPGTHNLISRSIDNKQFYERSFHKIFGYYKFIY